MCKKYTYEYVKSFIEENRYKLLSSEYINNKHILSIKCDKGHVFQMRFNDFQQGHRCKKCMISDRKHNKFTYLHVKEQIEKTGYKLLSTEYTDANKPLDMKCKNGHKIQLRYGNFQQGCRCHFCNGGVRYTYDYVKSFIEKENFELTSTEYINSSTKLSIKCSKNHIFDMTFNHFQQGHKCPECFKQQKFSIPEKEIFKFVKENYNNVVIENDRTTLRNPLTNRMLELDVYLPDTQKAIEYNGKHWHSSNYSKYKDNQKVIQCNQKGINLLIIEEKDWLTNKQKCLDKIKEFI